MPPSVTEPLMRHSGNVSNSNFICPISSCTSHVSGVLCGRVTGEQLLVAVAFQEVIQAVPLGHLGGFPLKARSAPCNQ